MLKSNVNQIGRGIMMLNYIKRIISISMIMILFMGVNLPQTTFASNTTKAAHDFNTEDVKEFADELLPKQLEKNHIVGATISVVKDGQVLFENGYGFYNQDMSKKVSPETTLFKIGSITKVFTWTAVMQLVEKGSINLDEDINRYLKDFKIPEAFNKPITMRNLMTHTAGFDDRLTNLFNPPDSEIIPLGTYLKDTMPKRIYPPGEIVAYSNYGASLAGFIVEQVSGEKYSEYINKNILKPLNMNNTFVEQPVPDAFKENVSLGFKYNNDSYKGSYDALIRLVPTGAISSTSEDMAKFMLMHLQNGKYGDTKILNEKTAEEMHSLQFAEDERLPGICLGFMEWKRNRKRIIWHSGGSELFMSLFMLIPEEKVGLFVSYNGPNADEARSELRQAFLDRYYPYEYKAAEPMEGYKERARRYEGSFMEARTAEYNSDKLAFALSRAKKVTANEDGSITFRDTKYVEVEPLVFSEVSGQGVLVFKENEKGEVTNAFQDFEPHETYIKVPWYMSAEIQMCILGVCLLIFLYSTLGSSIIKRTKLKKNWYTKDEDKLVLGRKLILWVCIFNLMFPIIAGLGIILDLTIGSQNILLGNIPLLTKISLFPPLVASILCCITLIYMINAWKNKIWSLSYRLQYTFILIVSIIFTCGLKYWNLLGFYL